MKSALWHYFLPCFPFILLWQTFGHFFRLSFPRDHQMEKKNVLLTKSHYHWLPAVSAASRSLAHGNSSSTGLTFSTINWELKVCDEGGHIQTGTIKFNNKAKSDLVTADGPAGCQSQEQNEGQIERDWHEWWFSFHPRIPLRPVEEGRSNQYPIA